MEPSPEAEERQRWEQRLEHLQRAVAQLEVDRSRLQQHNTQLRTTLEQVGDSGPQLLPAVRRKARISTSPAAPRAGGLETIARDQIWPALHF